MLNFETTSAMYSIAEVVKMCWSFFSKCHGVYLAITFRLCFSDIAKVFVQVVTDKVAIISKGMMVVQEEDMSQAFAPWVFLHTGERLCCDALLLDLIFFLRKSIGSLAHGSSWGEKIFLR